MRDKNIRGCLARFLQRRGKWFFINFPLMLLGCALLSGCNPVPKTRPVVMPNIAQSPILSSQTETLTPDELRKVYDTSPTQSYVLGPDDIISMYVYLHPELNVPTLNGGGSNGGAMITSDGTVGMPLLGQVHLGGLTLAQAQAKLTKDYSVYVNNPKLTLELVSAQSLKYYLLGEFASPGVKYPLHPLTLLEALALGGSVNVPDADLYQAYVAQGDVKLPVDLHALLVDGDLSQNIPLASGDTIFIPSSQNEVAYLFGAVGKPGPVQFVGGSLSLLQALASSGLDLTAYTNARLARIHIIRSHGKSAQFMIVDARAIMEGRASAFALRPGDIVFVPPTAVATWNQVLSQLLPSLQTISDVLNPFVSIRYLSR